MLLCNYRHKKIHAFCVVHHTKTRYRTYRLNPGALASHRRFRLMLLRSRPDMVHGFLLRKTQISTPVCPGSDYMQCPKQNITPAIKGSHTGTSPRPDITPAIADFRYREPLLPRLHGNVLTILIYTVMNTALFSIPIFRKYVKKFEFP